MRRVFENIFKQKPAVNPALAEVPEMLQQALALHQQGQIAQAQVLYEDILKIQPEHADAMHFLGLAAAQTNNMQRAKDLIGSAIEIDPDNVAFHVNYGNVLKELRQLGAALASYDRAIALNPEHAAIYCNRGAILKELGQLDAALASYDRAIALKADYAEAHYSHGLVLHELKQFGAALASYDRAIALKADHPEAYCNRGAALRELGQLERALASYERAIALKADYAEAWYNRGIVLDTLKQAGAALASYDQAIALKADYAEAWSNRGVALQALGQLDAALASHDRAIVLKADFAEAWSNRGVALQALGQLDAALASHDRAIALKADYAEGHSNRGAVLQQLRQLDAALASYDRAIALKADYAEAHSNRGTVFQELGQLDAALASYEQAIALKADYALPHYNKSLALLLRGLFDPGWALYEWRWKCKEIRTLLGTRNFPQPTWLGNESLAGKTILLYFEQGLGDTIQFCRYAKLVADLGARVILEVPKTLVGLVASLEGVAQVVGHGDALPHFDYQCPLLSLPLAFETNIKTIPSSTRYLSSDASKVAQWQARLGARDKLRIGVVWSSTSPFKDDSKRSVTLHDFARLLPEDGFEIICLQKEIKEIDEATLRLRSDVRFFGSELSDFSDTAALIECVDLVVSTCTSVPHLSCALSKPTWILLSYVPDWRWLLDRADSPWYPSARLYRQQRLGDWHGVFEQVKADLLQLAQRESRGMR